jgi:DNA replication ATP-dependent helicase Dna2
MPHAETSPDAATSATATAQEGGCFLCAYADHPCSVGQVDGRVGGAVERWRGGRLPALRLDTAAGPLGVVLDERDRPLARMLAALTPEQRHSLRARVYHLHRAPSSMPPADEQTADTPARYPTLRASPASAVVLEPDLLLNITDINNAEYCARQYILRRIIPSPPTAATLRGTIVHNAFKELVKGRGEEPAALLRQVLDAYATELAIHQIAPAEIAADAEPHLDALAAWYQHERQDLWRTRPDVRVETFLLAPQVGLRGRLDALWEDEYTSQLLELKTSTVRGELPKREHRWQVYGYQTLLAARRQGEQGRPRPAKLVYSGTPGQAEAYGLGFALRELQRVLELRNELAVAHVTGHVPAPPGERKCARCAVRAGCLRAAPLLGWEPPPSDEQPAPVDPADAAEFRRYYDLLGIEGRAAEEAVRLLWTTTPEQRRAAGSAIGDLVAEGEPQVTASGEWHYTFRCQNTSELREGDAVLLSDGDPIYGAAVTGTLLEVKDSLVRLWTPERIPHPALIDRYGSEMVHDRTVRNLWRWLEADPRLRALVRGERAPEFDATPDLAPTVARDLNPEQRHAVARALAARDCLLIQGPPGTGKTRVVAEIVRALAARGERILIAAFTNQAVDNVLRRLHGDGFTDFIRLGHELSVAPELHHRRLAAAAGMGAPSAGENVPHGDAAAAGIAALDPARLRAALLRAPVVASTSATWSAERYDAAGAALAFDVAIVDEASQLTVPAVLGALRFARRFILVGDDQQLPPLVVSAEAAAGGLKESLFARLLARWGKRASVVLTRQYRMHPVICDFPSTEFYGGALVADGAARTARLELAAGSPDGLDGVLDPARPVVLLDVPAGAEATGTSRGSAAQAALVGRLVRGLRERGVAAGQIGVIAPFRAQVALVRRRLVALGEPEVVADTVDRFQGGEREVIVLTFGLPRGLPHGSAARQLDTSFVADPNRLNVALTRAQRKLILVGDRALLERSPLLARLVDYCAGLYGGQGGVLRAAVERTAARATGT